MELYCIDDVAVSTFTKRPWVACLRLVSDGKVTTEVRTFQTTTVDLLRLSEWLAANDCTHVAMEARPAFTGSQCGTSWMMGSSSWCWQNAAHV